MESAEYDWSKYSWIRATDIPLLKQKYGKLHLFYEGVEPNDIKQGELGNCYFLSTLSVLSEKSNRIKKLFLDGEISE